MHNVNTMPLWLCFTLLFSVVGCKTSKTLQKSSATAPENIELLADSVEYLVDSIEYTKTTIDKTYIQDSVNIAVFRILKDTVSIIGVGDIMMGTNYPDDGYLPPANGKYLLQDVNHILKNADITFGNLEGVVLNQGGEAKYCKNPKICYIFRSPEIITTNLITAGFDVMSTANNHAGDFGTTGRKNTMKVLDSLKIEHAGLLEKPMTTFIKDGMKYGFAAFAPNTGTVSINDINRAEEIIKHLDSISDIVIVSFHGGAEGSKYQHVTRENEYFYGENRGNVYEFSHKMIDAGADIIFGHGPHVTRAVEVYKNKFIAYSLGNFCTYARFNLRGDNGLAPILKVFTGPDGQFLYGQITPIIQIGAGVPKIDSQGRVIENIRELTKKDFPDVPIMIDETGRINYLQK